MSTMLKSIVAASALVLFTPLFLACGSGGSKGGPTATPTPIPEPPAPASTVVPPCDGEAANPSISYYRLRIEYTSSSDWSSLSIVDPAPIIKARQMSKLGNPTNASVRSDGMGLNQPLDNAVDVGLTVDYALRPAALDAPFKLQVKKGVAGKVKVRVSSVVDSTLTVLSETEDTKPRDISVDLSSLKGSSPWVAPLAPIRRMAWAVYYPWYSLSSWTSKEVKDQPSTLYASDKPADIERQMDQAKAAGIDGFLCSWWGPGSGTDKNLALILEAAKKKSFSVAIFLETMDGDTPRDEKTLTDWLSYYVRTYRDHPALMKVNGKPLVMPWVTALVPVSTWQNVVNALHDQQLDATLLADCSRMEYLTCMDGAMGSDPETGRNVRYYAVLADSPTPKIWVGNAQPGFDERLLSGRTGRYIDREGGLRFRRQLNAAMLGNPQWVRLETWNEYWENTHIEPSKLNGDLYLQILHEYTSLWKCP